MPMHFTQSCPTCGRRLQVHTRLLGQNVGCQHCHAEFVANGEDESIVRSQPSQDLLARAEAMLKLTQPIQSPAPSVIGVELV